MSNNAQCKCQRCIHVRMQSKEYRNKRRSTENTIGIALLLSQCCVVAALLQNADAMRVDIFSQHWALYNQKVVCCLRWTLVLWLFTRTASSPIRVPFPLSPRITIYAIKLTRSHVEGTPLLMRKVNNETNKIKVCRKRNVKLSLTLSLWGKTLN